MLDLKVDHTLQPRLPDAQDLSAADVLSEQHTEVRGRQGRGLIFLGKIDQGKACACGNQQTVLGSVVLYGQQQLVVFRLRDFIDFSACNGFV